MQRNDTYSDEIGVALLAYIRAVCSAVVNDLKLCLTSYHTHHSEDVPLPNGNVMQLNYNVIKYPLPANAFLMVIQDAQTSNLFQVASTCNSARTRYVFYCIGDITSKKIPSYANNFDNYDSVQDYTKFVLFNGDRARHTCTEAMQYVDLGGELDAIFDDNIDEDIDTERLVDHFEDICELCVKHSAPAIANSIDLTSINTTRRLELFNQMFSGGGLSLFGRKILNKDLKAMNRCPQE